MKTLMKVGDHTVEDAGDGIYLLIDTAGRTQGTFFSRPGTRWWTGRDVLGSVREVYVEPGIEDQVANVAERLTRP